MAISENYDLIVVGGGIGGSALATVMARAGHSVLVLEKSEIYLDNVRGEWISPWGVLEVRRLGLYDSLLAAGGHHLARHIQYDEGRSAAESESEAIPLSIFAPGVPGPLCIGHPLHCQTLNDAARSAGATTLRGADVRGIDLSDGAVVTYVVAGEERSARARLLVGADGRTSQVREAAGVNLFQDKPHHWFAGILVDEVEDWSEDLQAIGTEGDLGFLAFPQGNGRVRLYGGYGLEQRKRFAGPEGPRRFLEAFRMNCSPKNRHFAEGRQAGPLYSYHNNDSWTDEPYAPGVVLVGDAAGWNDPILGLGLSITYRDVRIVTDLLRESADWSTLSFASYGEERGERMRRLRFVAQVQAALDMEFGDAARERRTSYLKRSRTDPALRQHVFAIMAGPEAAPPETFTPEHRSYILGESGA